MSRLNPNFTNCSIATYFHCLPWSSEINGLNISSATCKLAMLSSASRQSKNDGVICWIWVGLVCNLKGHLGTSAPLSSPILSHSSDFGRDRVVAFCGCHVRRFCFFSIQMLAHQCHWVLRVTHAKAEGLRHWALWSSLAVVTCTISLPISTSPIWCAANVRACLSAAKNTFRVFVHLRNFLADHLSGEDWQPLPAIQMATHGDEFSQKRAAVLAQPVLI